MIDLTAGVYVPFSVTVSVKRMILLCLHYYLPSPNANKKKAIIPRVSRYVFFDLKLLCLKPLKISF